ncbi:MAG: rod shape-determining protein RodA [Neisseriaceae bacterium]|nr:MAG: rod shape-determining protein RodA [Neisseriaceae bacterium]
MEIEITNSDDYPVWIDSYQHGKIIINNMTYTQPIFIRDKHIQIVNKSFQELTIDDLLITSESKPEIIILGTGEKQIFLPGKLQVELYQNGLRVDTMNTASATHTLNLLIADNRRVWAWLWPF